MEQDNNSRTTVFEINAGTVEVTAKIVGRRDIVISAKLDDQIVSGSFDIVRNHPTCVGRIGKIGLVPENYAKVKAIQNELKAIIAAADSRKAEYEKGIRDTEIGHGHDADNAANA